MHFFALWCELCLRLTTASIDNGWSEWGGSYDVYDCADVNWTRLLLDAKHHRRALTRVFGIGGHNYPGCMYRCYIVNAPYSASLLWRLVRPLMNAEARRKVSLSSGVPPDLVDILGGNAAFCRMLECSPHVMPHCTLDKNEEPTP